MQAYFAAMVIGQPVAAPEIAAILYPSGQQCSSTQPIVTYPKNSVGRRVRNASGAEVLTSGTTATEDLIGVSGEIHLLTNTL